MAGLLLHKSTVADGVILTTPQLYPGKLMVAVGAFLTSIVWLDLKVPQALVTFCINVYFPGLVKLMDGLAELSLVPFTKVNAGAVPQKAAA